MVVVLADVEAEPEAMRCRPITVQHQEVRTPRREPRDYRAWDYDHFYLTHHSFAEPERPPKRNSVLVDTFTLTSEHSVEGVGLHQRCFTCCYWVCILLLFLLLIALLCYCSGLVDFVWKRCYK